MEEQVGLAAQGQAQNPMADFMKIVELLKQGITPEELVAAGVPQEVVEEAMAMIMKDQQVAPEQAGLAGMQIQGM